MGRTQGRKPPRPATVDPDSPQGRQIGMSHRTQGVPSPIPGSETHIVNPATVRQPVPIPAAQGEYRGTMAHGVPPGSATTRDRAEMQRGARHGPAPAPVHVPSTEPPVPIPVVVVEPGGGRSALRCAAPHWITVPGNTGDPVRICGRDLARAQVLLLNEDPDTHNIRFAHRISDLETGGGALLKAGATSYLKLSTQDELFALSDDATAVPLSIIQEYMQPW